MQTALVSLSLCFAPCLASAAEHWGQDHPLRRIKSETLVYEAKSSKGVALFDVTVPLGTTTFTLSREEVDGERQIVFKAHARGGVPQYPLDATITSRLREADFLMRFSGSHRIKPRYKRRIVRFHERGADYLKHKHCEAPTLCHNPSHWITRPDGTNVHCPDHKTCKKPEHFVWSLRYRHRFQGRAYDMLAGLYLARGLPIEIGGEPQKLRVISNRNMWDVVIEPLKEETITVPAGKFDCIEFRFRTEAANDYSRAHEDEVEGPFGLHGGVSLYADKLTRHVVRVRGKVKLGATFDVQVDLKERTVEYFPEAAR